MAAETIFIRKERKYLALHAGIRLGEGSQED
jgi:hypothetical protein